LHVWSGVTITGKTLNTYKYAVGLVLKVKFAGRLWALFLSIGV